METIIFEPSERTKTIDLPTLKRTLSLSEFSGKLPTTKPIEHHDFIELIQEKLDKQNVLAKLDPIYVSKGESKRIMALDPERVGKVESFLFQRLVTRLQLSGADYKTKKENMSIAIGYTDQGLQVAFGPNVKICSNMCIFGSRLLVTYGNQKLPFDKMVQLIEKYIQELPAMAESDFKILREMEQVQFMPEEVIKLVGEMHVSSVKNSYFPKAQSDAPFTITQMNSFTKGMLEQRPDIMNLNGPAVSAYDLYNYGTEVLHPSRSEVATVWPDVASFTDFFTQKLSLS